MTILTKRGQKINSSDAIKPVNRLDALKQYKDKTGIGDPKSLLKPSRIILFSAGLRAAMGIENLGFEAGNMILYTGRSNTGKTTEAIANMITAINDGDVGVIFDMEDKFNFQRARNMGLEFTIKKYSIETGELLATEGDENFNDIEGDDVALDYEGNFIYYNTTTLYNKYQKKLGGVVTFENLVEEIDKLCTMQKEQSANGNIFGYFFIVDSFDKVQSKKYYDGLLGAKGDLLESDETKAQAQMNTAYKNNALELTIKKHITPTKSASFPYTNTIVMMTSLYDAVSGMQAIGKEYGGNKLKGMSPVQMRFGNQLTSGAKNQYEGKGKKLIGTSVSVELVKIHSSTGTESYLCKAEIVNTKHGSIPNNKESILKYCNIHKELFVGEVFDIFEEDAD